jgi:hypothetical protein
MTVDEKLQKMAILLLVLHYNEVRVDPRLVDDVKKIAAGEE